MTITADTMGGRIRALRQQHGLTLQGLADLTEISKSFISGIEHDTCGVSAERLMRLSDALGCTADYLVRGRQNLPVPPAGPICVPERLDEYAQAKNLPYWQVLTLLDVHRILRHYRVGPTRMRECDWQYLHQALLPHLE